MTDRLPNTRLQDSAADMQRRAIRAPSALNLHVDLLVLDGFPSAHRFTIGQAVESELARLFAEHGVPPSLAKLGEIEHLTGGSFALTPKCRPAVIGAEVANRVYQTLL